jgi:hypothetical protein
MKPGPPGVPSLHETTLEGRKEGMTKMAQIQPWDILLTKANSNQPALAELTSALDQIGNARPPGAIGTLVTSSPKFR